MSADGIHKYKTVIIVYQCKLMFFLLTMINAQGKITLDKSNNNWYYIYAQLIIN